MQAPGCPERFDEVPLQLRFTGVPLIRPVPPDGCPFHQQSIDVSRRVRDHRLEEASLAPVPPEVTGVEHSLAVCLDQQGVGIERAVIDQIRRHTERPDLQRCPVLDEARGSEGAAVADVAARRRQNAVRILILRSTRSR